MSGLRCLCALAVFAAFCDRGLAGNYTWSNAAGGNWNVVGNWSPTGVPGASDNASLNALANSYTVQLTDTRSISNLTIGSSTATLAVSANLTIGGALAVSAGEFDLTAGTLTLSGTNGQVGGTLAYSGGSIIPTGSTVPVLTNLAAGVIDFRADGTAFALGGFNATGTLANQGTIRKSVGSPASSTTVAWGVNLQNGGTIDAQVGTLNFDGGGTLGNGTTTITGAGVAALDLGTFTIPNGATFTAAGQGGANLNWTGGTLTAGNTGGTLAGTLIASAGANGKSISGTALQVSGTLAWTGGSIAPATAQNSPVLTTLPAGVIDFRADGAAFADTAFTSGTLVNQGTLHKSAGITTTSVTWAVLNSGTVRVDVASILNLTGGVTNTGVVTMVNGATISGSITSNTSGVVQGPAGGTGTYTGLLTFNSGSTLAPGGGQAGALVVNNNLVMGSGATLFICLAGSTPVSGFSRVSVNGTVTLNNATLSGDTTGFSPTSSDRLFILINDGSDAITGTFNGVPNNSTVIVGNFAATISYFGDSTTGALTGGNDVVLYNFQPVPEPGSVLMICAVGGATGGLWSWSRWRRAEGRAKRNP